MIYYHALELLSKLYASNPIYTMFVVLLGRFVKMHLSFRCFFLCVLKLIPMHRSCSVCSCSSSCKRALFIIENDLFGLECLPNCTLILYNITSEEKNGLLRCKS